MMYLIWETHINEYQTKFDIQENWYRAKTKLKGQKEFLIMDPDGYLLRFVRNLVNGES
jgi:hypothetical protein